MAKRKILKILALVFVLGIGIFAFFLFYTVKTKSTSLNEYEPFTKWIGKTVRLNKKVIVFKNTEHPSHINSDYPYTLMDSLHPLWSHIQELKTLPKPGIEDLTEVPEGTGLHLEKAIQYTNGTSGSSYPTIFGTLHYQNKAYKVGYQWGELNTLKYFDNIEKCWQFHQAPWQGKHDTNFYALPEAKWW